MRYLVPLLFLVGCGFSTGVSGSKTLGELTEDELCEIQDASADYADKKLSDSDFCYVSAQFAAAFNDGDFEGTCEAAYEECLNSSDDLVAEECSTDEVFLYPETCTATVGDYEACFLAELDAFKEIAKNKCNEGGLEDMTDASSVAECDAVYSADCTGIAF